MRYAAGGALAAVMAGCVKEDGISEKERGELDALIDRIETLEAENAALQGQIDAMGSGTVTEEDLADYALAADVAALESDVAALAADVGALTSDVTDHEDRIAAIEDDYLQAADLTGYATETWVGSQGYATETWVTSLGYATQTWVTSLGYTTQSWVSSQGYATETWVDSQGYATVDWVTGEGYATEEWVEEQGYLADLAGWQIDSDAQIDVPADYATLSEALASLDHVSIASDATVQIVLASGTYSFTEAIEINHPDGDRIEILGGGLGAELAFAGSHGFVVEDGSRLGLLDNVVLTGDGADDTYGIYAATNGTITLGEDVTISGFQHGVLTMLGGVVVADGIASDDNLSAGFYARYGSLISAVGATATDNSTYGFAAAYGAGVYAQGAVVTGAGTDGYLSFGGSWMDVQSSSSSGATSRAGYYAADNATILADNATVSDTGGIGYSFLAYDQSFLSIQAAAGSTGSGCYAHTKSLLHTNGATSCPSAYPSVVAESLNTSSPSGALISW